MIHTLTNGSAITPTKWNENFSFNDNANAINSKIFCQLLSDGQITASGIDNIISNTGLPGTPSNPYSGKWVDILPNFSTFLSYNNNINLTTDGVLDIFYLNNVGSLVAGRLNLLTDTFTVTHTITSANFPVATGDATYNIDKHEHKKFYMLTASNTLIYGLITTYDQDASPDRCGLFVDAKVYNSAGEVIQTYEVRLLTATSGDSYNGFGVYDNMGYYTNGNTAYAYCPVISIESDTDSDDESYYPCNLNYNGSAFSATTGGYINYVLDDREYVDIKPLYLNNNVLYIKYAGEEDDGGSTDEYSLDGIIYTKNLTTMAHEVLVSQSDYSHSNHTFQVVVIADALYFRYEYGEDSGNDYGYVNLLINGTSVWSNYQSDANVRIDYSYLLMPEGFEFYGSIKESGVIRSSIFTAQNRIAGTSATITQNSTVSAGNLYTNSATGCPVYIFLETDGTKHFADIDSTGYRVYDRITGSVSFTDDITDTYAENVFAYFNPYINIFWLDFKKSISTTIDVDNGSEIVELTANIWDNYDDLIDSIDLNINSNLGPLYGTSNLSYYILYDI